MSGNSQQSPHKETLLEALDVEGAVLPPLVKLVLHLEPTYIKRVFPPANKEERKETTRSGRIPLETAMPKYRNAKTACFFCASRLPTELWTLLMKTKTKTKTNSSTCTPRPPPSHRQDKSTHRQILRGGVCTSHLSATIESGLPTKLSNTASIALSDSSRLAMPLVTAFTSPPKASLRAG